MTGLPSIALPSSSQSKLFFEDYPHHRSCHKYISLSLLPRKKSLLLGEGGTPQACRMRGRFFPHAQNTVRDATDKNDVKMVSCF